MTGSGSSADDIWLAATWPFVRDQLPRPPARVIELGCGEAGGQVTALLDAGYDATGVDPEAPEGPAYKRIAFEDYWPDAPVNAVIASLSLHHVADPATVLDHVSRVLAPGGILVVIEWISERFDEATATWCFRLKIRDRAQPGAWLAELRDEWAESALPWEVFCRGWLEHHGLHSASSIRRALDARFVTTHDSGGPYYFPDLLDADAVAEQAAIDTGAIKAGCLRYAGRRFALAAVSTDDLCAGEPSSKRERCGWAGNSDRRVAVRPASSDVFEEVAILMADPAQVMSLPIARQLLREEAILHLSYTARDGAPRVIPIGYLWDGHSFRMWTVPGSAKVGALQADERVAITIDIPGPPPRVLLVRGRAALAAVDGVPDGYLEASRRGMPPEAWEGFEAQVRALYKQMVAITVTPEWARLLDFETTAPRAVEKLVRERTSADTGT
jgi:SAM-dependent methyltransferase